MFLLSGRHLIKIVFLRRLSRMLCFFACVVLPFSYEIAAVFHVLEGFGGMRLAMKIWMQDHVAMAPSVLSRVGAFSAISLGLFLSLAVSAYAADPPARRNDPNGPKPPKPSGLNGDLRAQCIAGTYPASNMCKPAPPGFYAPPDTVYPVPCPNGKTLNYGARGTSECF